MFTRYDTEMMAFFTGVQAVDVLRECVMTDSSVIPADETNLTYSYEEGENPEEFFIPYAWKTAVCSTVIME